MHLPAIFMLCCLTSKSFAFFVGSARAGGSREMRHKWWLNSLYLYYQIKPVDNRFFSHLKIKEKP